MTTPVLSLSVSPASVHLPVTARGIAAYHGSVILTDNGSKPVHVAVSAQGASCGKSSPSWIHVSASGVTLQPGQPTVVSYTVDGGASGSAYIVAAATAPGTGNVHLSGAVGAHVTAGTATHASCASAPTAAPASGFPLLAVLLPILAVLAILVATAAMRRRNRKASS